MSQLIERDGRFYNALPRYLKIILEGTKPFFSIHNRKEELIASYKAGEILRLRDHALSLSGFLPCDQHMPDWPDVSVMFTAWLQDEHLEKRQRIMELECDDRAHLKGKGPMISALRGRVARIHVELEKRGVIVAR